MEHTASAKYREEAERAERLAELAISEELRRELLEIAADFRAKGEVSQRRELKRLTAQEAGL